MSGKQRRPLFASGFDDRDFFDLGARPSPAPTFPPGGGGGGGDDSGGIGSNAYLANPNFALGNYPDPLRTYIGEALSTLDAIHDSSPTALYGKTLLAMANSGESYEIGRHLNTQVMAAAHLLWLTGAPVIVTVLQDILDHVLAQAIEEDAYGAAMLDWSNTGNPDVGATPYDDATVRLEDSMSLGTIAILTRVSKENGGNYQPGQTYLEAGWRRWEDDGADEPRWQGGGSLAHTNPNWRERGFYHAVICRARMAWHLWKITGNANYKTGFDILADNALMNAMGAVQNTDRATWSHGVDSTQTVWTDSQSVTYIRYSLPSIYELAIEGAFAAYPFDMAAVQRGMHTYLLSQGSQTGGNTTDGATVTIDRYNGLGTHTFGDPGAPENSNDWYNFFWPAAPESASLLTRLGNLRSAGSNDYTRMLGAPTAFVVEEFDQLEPTVLYVDAVEGNDGNTGGISAPLKTLNEAGTRLAALSLADRADARVYLRGTITEYNHKGGPSDPTGRNTSFPYNLSSWTFDGVEGRPVKIMTDPDEASPAVLDGSSVPQDYANRSNPSSPYLLWINGDNIEVDGVDSRLSAGQGIAWGGTFRTTGAAVHNGAIRNGEHMFHHGDGVYVSGNDESESERGTGFVAQNCSFHHCQDHLNGGNSASGLKIVANRGAKVITCISFKNSDDGFDNYASRGNELQDSWAWSNGYYSSETISTWSKYNRADLTEAPQGNGNGFKMAGGTPDATRGGADNIAHHCASFWNKVIGFTHNSLQNGLLYNNTAFENGGHGFNFRDGTTLVGNLAFGNNNGGAEVFFDNSNGDWPPNESNSWGNGESLGNPFSLNNFNVSDIANQIISLDPGHPGFLVPVEGGTLDGSNEVPASFSITHPESHIVTEADMPGITPTLGFSAPEAILLNELDVLSGTTGATSYPAAGSAFPSAEGWGRDATGGRGGSIVFITNVNTTGTGSARAALEQLGARYVIPLAWGYVDFADQGGITVSNGNVTYFGQFMPETSKGLAFRGGGIGTTLVFDGNNLILRYLKSYRGVPVPDTVISGGDALTMQANSNYIIDRCTLAFGVDENLNLFQPDTGTVQHSYVIESIHDATHDKGDHGKGSSIGWGTPQAITTLGNFWSLNDDRNPVMRQESNSARPNEHVNNYAYNCDVPPNFSEDQTTDNDGWVNVVKNHTENGPASTKANWAYMGKHQTGLGEVHLYAESNIGPGRPTDIGDEFDGINDRGGLNRLVARVSGAPLLRELTVESVKGRVLDFGGPGYVLRQSAGGVVFTLVDVRDAMHINNVTQAKNGTGPATFHTSVHGDAGVDTYSFPTLPTGSISVQEFWDDYYNPVATQRGWPTGEVGALSQDPVTGMDYIELYMLLWVPDFPSLGVGDLP